MKRKDCKASKQSTILDGYVLGTMCKQLAELLGHAPTQVELSDMIRGYLDQRERLDVLEETLTSEELELALESELDSIYGGNSREQ